jgi:hypothetical protein
LSKLPFTLSGSKAIKNYENVRREHRQTLECLHLPSWKIHPRAVLLDRRRLVHYFLSSLSLTHSLCFTSIDRGSGFIEMFVYRKHADGCNEDGLKEEEEEKRKQQK